MDAKYCGVGILKKPEMNARVLKEGLGRAALNPATAKCSLAV